MKLSIRLKYLFLISLLLSVYTSGCQDRKNNIEHPAKSERSAHDINQSLPSIKLTDTAISEDTVPQNGWKSAPNLIKGRFGAPVVYNRDYIYVIGGENGMDTYNSVEYSHIKKDGQLENWRYASYMPMEVAWSSAVVKNNNIYVVGGSNGKNGTNILDTVLSVSIHPDGSLGEWRVERFKLNMGRRAIGLLEAKGYIYALGGFNAVVLDSVERARIMEDGTLGKWEYQSPLLKRRYILSSLKIGSYIYALGGHFADGTSTSTVERAKVLADGKLSDWEETSPMSSTRFMSASVKYNDEIFIIGGSQGGNIKNTIEHTKLMDTNNLGKWDRAKVILDETRGGAGSIFVGRTLYVIGGANRQSVLPTVIRISVSPDYTLSKKAMSNPLINARYLMPVVKSRDNIYVIGGFNDHNQPYSSIERTKGIRNGMISKWVEDDSRLNIARGWHSSVIHRGYIYVIGGFDGKNELKFNEYAKIMADGSLGKWHLVTPLSTSRKGAAAVVIGHYIYAIGGFNGKRLKSIERAPINEDGTIGRWKITGSSLTVPRSGHMAFVEGNYLYVIGGLDGSNNPLGTIERTEILHGEDIGKWEKIDSILPAERYAFGFSVLDNHLFIVGGLSKSQFMNNIEVASVDPNGHLTDWRNTMRLPGPQPGTAAIIAHNRLYTIGGLSPDIQHTVYHISMDSLVSYRSKD